MQIVWFRRDLRLRDNEIISQAARDGLEVLPCFIIDPWFYQQPEIGIARVKFFFESLENLDANLQKQGSRLYLFEGESVAVVRNLTVTLLKQDKSPKLYFNRDVQVEYGINRDRQILEFYRQHNLEVYIGLNHFLQNNECYETWWRDYHDYQAQPLHPTPQQINTPLLKLDLPQLTFSELWQKYCPETKIGTNKFIGGEDNARNTLDSFLASRYQGYHWKMSYPWMAQQGATSHLSPHLAFGTISSRSIYQRTKQLEQNSQSKNKYALSTFLDRVRWHDKFTQRHYYHPELAWSNRYPEFDDWYSPEEPSGEKKELFMAWCEARTGFPMVDASMRQLNRMGWMSFRMRAMCVTFLCINCGVSWHHGARYFMSRLVDGDLAINHWQWQMQSGVANPMSDTFRIYNPTKNLQEKDSYLQFVRYWIPELKGYSLDKLLNNEYPSSYSQLILDWKQTRKINGKVVSDLRKKVRERLTREGGNEYRQAIEAASTVEKYLAVKDKQYRKIINYE